MNYKLETHKFYCTKCGKEGIPIVRKKASQREPGHLKNLYCLYCKEETNHAECRPIGKYTYDDFRLEFDLGRFVDGKKLPISELPQCSKTDCQYCIDGKCWNTNNSYNCKHKGGI